MSQLGPKENAALNLLASEGKEYENYFFSKAKDLKWFGSLKERGYFDAPKNQQGRVKFFHSCLLYYSKQYNAMK